MSPAKRMAMANVVRHLRETKHHAMNVLKIDRFLADSDWSLVERSTMVTDPYHTAEEQVLLKLFTFFIISLGSVVSINHFLQ